MKRTSILIIFALVASALAAQPRVVLSIGHSGAVRDAVAHPSDPIAFTVGDDGRLLVWDLELGALLYRYQVSHRPIIRIAHHPTRDEVAVVVSDGVDRSSIHVIDWHTGDELFHRDLDSVPVYLGYSPGGSYLIFTLPTFRSLFFLSADTGAARSYLDDGFGIVNFVQMAASERNVMTYVPARGEFIYWNLQSGDELQRVRTTARLTHLTLVDPVNRRALAAAGPDGFVIVDNLTGEVRATYPILPIRDIRFDAANDRIMVLTEQLGRPAIVSFSYQFGRLRRESYRPSPLSPETKFVVPLPDSANAVLAGAADGTVELFSDLSGRRTELGPRPTVPVLDAAFTEGRLHLSLGDRILSLVSDAFQSTARRIRISSIRQSVTTLEGLSDAHIERSGEQLLIWGDGDPAGGVYSLTPPSTQAREYYLDERENPVLAVHATSGGPIVIHRDGRVIQLAPGFAVERFRYVAPGTMASTWDPETGMIVAKTKSSSLDSSLIRVDQLTGETVRISSSAFLSTAVALGDRSTLYAIGLFGNPASPTTQLVRYGGERFAQRSTLVEFAGEDSMADVVWDDQSETLLTTIGYDGLQRIDGRTSTRLGSPGQIAREITVGGLFIAAVNEDGSVSVWKRATGELLFDLYVFEDSGWIAITADGSFLASNSRLERYLDFVPDGRRGLDINDFRVELPYRE